MSEGRKKIDQISQKKIENSAIGSWAGFIYQGLCAIYHVLSLIGKDDEEFSIHNKNKDIVSTSM